MFFVRKKKGQFYEIDAIIAITILILGLIYIKSLGSPPSIVKENKEYSQESVKLLRSMNVMDLSDEVLNELESSNLAVFTDRNFSIAKQIAIYYYFGNYSLAQNLTRIILDGLIPPTYGYTVLVTSQNNISKIYERGNELKSTDLQVSRTMITGLQQEKTIYGSKARLIMNNVPKDYSHYTFFGGYVGQGDISFNLTLLDKIRISKAYFEGNIVTNLSFFVNGQQCEKLIPEINDLDDSIIVSQFILPCINFEKNNLIELKFETDDIKKKYIGGGYFRIDYRRDNDSISSEQIKKYILGVDGIVNIYDSIFFDKPVNNMSIYLHFNNYANSIFTVRMGSYLINQTSTAGEFQIILDNNTLGKILNYTELTGKNIPFRIIAFNFTPEISPKKIDLLKYNAFSDTNTIRHGDFISLKTSELIPYKKIIAFTGFDMEINKTNYDFANNNYIGTYYDDTHTVSGKSLDSLYLDGNKDFFQIPSQQDISELKEIRYSENFTITLWFKANKLNEFQYLFWQGNTITDTDWKDNPDPLEMHISIGDYDGINEHPNTISFFLGNKNNRTKYPGVISIVTPFDSFQWNFLSIVVTNLSNNPYAEMFLNGVSIGSDKGSNSYTDIIKDFTGFLRIGTSYANKSYFKGMIDELMIFNMSLSADQINKIFNAEDIRFKKTGLINLEQLIPKETIYPIINFSIMKSFFPPNTAGAVRLAYWNEKYQYYDTSTDIIAYFHADNNTLINNVLETMSSNNGSAKKDTKHDIEGVIQNAATFDGIDDFISTTSKLPNTNFTYSFWAKSGTIGKENIPFGTSGTIVKWGSYNETSLFVQFNEESTGNLFTINANANNLLYGWHFVTVTLNSAIGAKLFFDGLEIDTNSQIKKIKNDLSIAIGSDSEQNNFFNGSIDEVKIWNITLTPAQILEVYSDEKSKNREYDRNNIMLEFRMDEDSWGIMDATGNIKDANINGQPKITNNGVYGSSLNFNGSTDFISLSHPLILGKEDEATISLWINSEKAYDTQYVYSEQYSLEKEDSGFHILLTPSSCGTMPDQLTVLFKIINENGDVIKLGNCMPNQLNKDSRVLLSKWTHVAASYKYDRTHNIVNTALFVNGIKTDEFKGDYNMSSIVPRYATIGSKRGQPAPKNYFKGNIDEFLVMNRALSDDEIFNVSISGRLRWNYTSFLPLKAKEHIFEINDNPSHIMPQIKLTSSDGWFSPVINPNYTINTISIAFSDQSIIKSTAQTTARIFPDSYITYTQESPQGEANKISYVHETGNIDSCENTSIDFTNFVQIRNAKLLAYSGKYWTDSINIKGLTNVYNASSWKTHFTDMGDPFAIGIPSELFGLQKSIIFESIDNMDSSGKVMNCSRNNKMIYSANIPSKFVSASSQILEKNEGCIWNVSLNNDTSSLLNIPPNYNGSRKCNYALGIYQSDNAVDYVTNYTFNAMDLNKDKILDFEINPEDIFIEVQTINKIPFLWGPAVLEVRVWK